MGRRASLPSSAHERAGVNAARLLGAVFERLAAQPAAAAMLLPPLLVPLLHVLCPPKSAAPPVTNPSRTLHIPLWKIGALNAQCGLGGWCTPC